MDLMKVYSCMIKYVEKNYGGIRSTWNYKFSYLIRDMKDLNVIGREWEFVKGVEQVCESGWISKRVF